MEYTGVSVKIERKKLYGWTETVATDREGNECVSTYLSVDDILIIPSGGLKQGTVDIDGRWLEKEDLIAYSEDGAEVLPILPSAFDVPIDLTEKVSISEFLDNDWKSIYQIDNPELATVVGDDIFKFEFSYRGGTNHNDGFHH